VIYFGGKLNAVKTDPIDDAIPGLRNMAVASSDVREGPKVCSIDDPTCEACQ
jgi:ribonucleoside-diphosphate reductase alpha chain